MIKVKLTENYTGVNIVGTFDDFYELYGSINYFLGYEESPDIFEEDMRLHILGFLYDLRHAYQGSRDILVVDNGLTDEEKEYFGIGKSVKKDVLYSFCYILPDILTDILLFKHFLKTKEKKINEFNTCYNNVMAFYSKVIDALQEILTENQVKKVRKMLSNSVISERNWLRQWFMKLSTEYVKMTKKKRQKEMMHILEKICDSYLYDEYYDIKKEVEEFAKDNEILVTEVAFGEYPKEISW